jgi:hypothetical protein
VMVADRGSGSRRRVAMAVRQQADVVVRSHPATCPLETAAGQPWNVRRWLRQRGSASREWHGWCCWAGQRDPVRRVAAKRDPTATRRARRRARRKAQPAGRTLTAPTLAVAGWVLLITPRAAGPWSTADVPALDINSLTPVRTLADCVGTIEVLQYQRSIPHVYRVCFASTPHTYWLNCDSSDTVGLTPQICKGNHDEP